ncbi:PREDICTED: sericin 1-like [Populus euphratica]|uniref:Sericin 1-like n=1 Tax=Populus euphratica TaxID=75702 RepID=A0AAJ6TG82_POPEU|nr:PREDICTED: sericin 1-like [Populus euphratica]
MMDMKGVGVGGGRVGVGEEDVGDGMQCSDHPYRNNPGGICAFCLQEKLGKLLSSSFPLPLRGSSSSSSSPSFRSDIGVGGSSNGGAGTSRSLAARPTATKCRNDGGNNSHYQEYYARRVRIPFLLAKKKKKIMVASSSSDRDIIFKRSKSTTTPMRGHFLDAATDDGEDFSPRRRGFWSFLYLSSSKPGTSTKKTEKVSSLAVTTRAITTTSTNGSTVRPKEKWLGSSLSRKGDSIVVVEDDDDSPNSQATASASNFERKVSRSRSVGCGSRSFSGDFFERISTGFGDCTLRRVESQREGKPKVTSGASHMKERVRCGGIFGGFNMTSSSSSSSSSSYWVSSSAEDMNGKSSGAGPLAHGRSRSWGWAFASPMRAFGSKPSSKDGKRNVKQTTPNLSAIPSLLAVRG